MLNRRRSFNISNRRFIATVLLGLFALNLTACSIPDWVPFVSESTETIASETSETTIPTTEATTTTMETTVETEYIPTMEEMARQYALEIKAALLNRNVTEAEIYADGFRIAGGEITPTEYVHEITSSEEFISRNLTDTQFLNVINEALLGGNLGDNQSMFLTNQLELMVPRDTIISMACGTSEFLNLVRNYGLATNNFAPVLDSASDIYDFVATIPGDEILSTTNGYFPSEEALTRITDALNTLDSNYRSVGFVLVDVNTGRGIAYNVDRKFYSASSIKGPYAASLCYYRPETIGTYAATYRMMLVNSDNDAFTRLFNTYRRPYIESWAEEAHVPLDSIMYKYPKIPTRDLFRLWIRNYLFFHDGSPEGEVCATWMREPEYSLIHSEFEGIYITESKAGWMVDEDPGHTTTVDAGIVYATSGPYIIAIESNVPRDIEPLRPLLQALDYAHEDMLMYFETNTNPDEE